MVLYCQRNSFYSTVLLYTYISRFCVNPHCQQQFYLRPSFVAFFNFFHKRPMFAFTDKSGYTLGSAQKIAHKGLHAETGGISDGGAVTTLGAFRTFTNIPGPGNRTAYFAAFGSWSGVLPKNAESLGTAMRLCASLSRGDAAPLGCVIFFASAEIAACTSCAQGFLRVRKRGGITTLGVLRVLLKRWAAACQSGSFAIFRGRVAFIDFSGAKCA